MSYEPEDHLDPRAGSPRRTSDQPEASPLSDNGAQSARYRAAYTANYMDESPELLRWRADSLLDEMMVGGLDVSAADTSVAPTAAPQRPVTTQPASPRPMPDERRDFNGDLWRSQQPAPNHPPAGAFDPEPEYGRGEASPRGDAPRGDASRVDAVDRLRDNADPRHDHRREAGYEAERTARPTDARPESNGIPANRSEYAAPGSTRSDYAASGSTRSDYAASGSTRSDYAASAPDASDQAAARREQFQLDEIGVRPPRLQPDRAMPEATPRPLESVRSGETPAETTGSAGRTDRLYGLEQKYEQARRDQESSVRPVPPKTPVASTEPGEGDPWPDPGQKWLEHDFGATPEPEIEPPAVDYGSYRAPRYEEPDSPVRSDPAGFVNAMSVSSGKKRRSTLLPRMSEVSADALQQEITRLHAELAELLPVGHEAAERARHLLDKAYSILQSDPMRSAEVEYYMQQVRTIVQRQSQARDWSNHYRDRLRVYLLSWTSFAAIVLLARFVFQLQIEDALAGGLGLNPNGAFIHHFAAWLGTGMAGALGGAIGALYTMRQHATNSQYNFFDRKYGLRGLILPIIGLLVGWLGYFVFGLLFGLFGINPSANLFAGTLPALAAFAFGFSQESIYGTRS